MHRPEFQILITPTDLAEIWYSEVFWALAVNIKSDLTFKTFKILL